MSGMGPKRQSDSVENMLRNNVIISLSCCGERPRMTGV